MVIDRIFVEKITSPNGRLLMDQRLLLSRVLPDGARTGNEILEALKGVRISEHKAEQLLALRKWAENKKRKFEKRYAEKRKGRQ